MNDFLELRKVWLDLGQFKLKGINLEVKQSEFFVILGPSGAGKTVLLETIAGFHHPSGGEIILEGEKINYKTPEQRGVGLVFQDYALFDHMKVRENIEFGLRYHRRRNQSQWIEELMRELGIAHLKDKLPQELSGGEKQRVALARALAIEPRLFLFDEPLSSLDPNLRAKLRDRLREIIQKFGITSLYVTHDRTEAMVLADRIAVIQNGEILQVGTPQEVFNKPANESVAEFVGVENILPGEVVESNGLTTIKIGDKTFQTTSVVEPGNALLAIRPEDITLHKSYNGQSSARNSLYGQIKELTHLGAVLKVSLNCDGLELKALITKKSAVEMNLKPKTKIYASFKATAAHIISK